MEYSNLPLIYQELVKKNIKADFIQESLLANFVFGNTLEGSDFWWECVNAKTIQELPPIPTQNISIEYVQGLIKIFEGKTDTSVQVTLDSDNKYKIRVLDTYSVYPYEFDTIIELIEYLLNGYVQGDTI